MITLFHHKQECCGCEACAAVCPRHAIKMQADEEGFLYPELDAKKCIECQKCLRVCAFQQRTESENHKPPLVYAAKHRDEAVRMSSSSGGMFTALSDAILSVNGTVYGAVYDDSGIQVRHAAAETRRDRDKMRGSKYMQSRMGDCYIDIKRRMNSGKKIFFTGTPCQVAAMKSFLGTESNDIIFCDIVCHGVPSPNIFPQYLKWLEKKYKSKYERFSFRDKRYGWQVMAVEFQNGKKYIGNNADDIYYNLFLNHFILRPSCHNCKYTTVYRCSDLTIADYWGIDRVMPDFYDEKGVSLILVHTQKGKMLLESIEKDIDFRESGLEKCMQPQLQHPSRPATYRARFWKRYNTNGFEHVFNRLWLHKKTIHMIKKLLKQLRLLVTQTSHIENSC